MSQLAFSRCWHCLKPLVGSTETMRAIGYGDGRRVVHEECVIDAVAAMNTLEGRVPPLPVVQ